MRHSHLFSLVIFKIEVIENTDVSGNAFITRLVERLRTSDEVGWYDRKQLGLILPYTDGSDAGIVAENICNIKESTNIFDVFTYPDNWFDVEWRSDNKRVTVNTAQSVIKEKSEVREVKVDVPEVKKADEVVDQAGGIKLEDYSRFFPGFKFPFWKRTLDIFGSSMGIIFLSPLFIIVAVLIKLSSRGAVFFKQDRLGFRQEKFKLYKFRTMYSDSDTRSHSQYLRKLIKHADNEPMTKLIDDPRVFRLGKILRMTYIDELPQLINVLRGEMSLVGPRPCLPYEAEEYLQWHKRRFFIKPGLTGLWQVSGKNKLTFKSMIRMDIKYEIERTIWLDLKIIFKTIPTIILEAFEDSGNR
ncbi:MAG: sugar transferase [bacterium]|nr:sugar transferase [bacterium]